MTIIGIDLGTTNSVVSIVENNEIKVVPNNQGTITTPSIVAFNEEQILVGNPAKNQAVTNPKRTIASIKRIIGQRVGESAVEKFRHTVSYQLTEEVDKPVKIKIENKTITPQEISAKILRDLKKYSEEYLGKTITDAVITVPAYFNDSQRQATKDAGIIAGLNVKRIINEPTAAALAFGFKESDKETKIAVFDLGGGTFDISILEIGGGVLEVRSTNGDTYLGGDDFDLTVLNYLSDLFQKENGIDLRKDPVSFQRLKEASEKAKCELSSALITTINLPYVAVDRSGQPLHLKTDLNRSKFEALIKSFMTRIEVCCKQAIVDSRIPLEEIEHVLLVGGSTRIPLVQNLVRKIFGKEPNRSVNPDEVVARGAAVQGAILSGNETRMVLLDVTPLSLGLETANEEMDILIPRNTTIPVSVTEMYTTQDDCQEGVDILVFQGEHRRAARNRLLGSFELDGLEPVEAGVPQIEVTFSIDVNGILNVAAKDLDTGKEQHITIKNPSSLSEKEIKKMQEEALKSEQEDQKYVRLKQLTLDAENMIEQATLGLEEFGKNLSQEEKEALGGAKKQLQDALLSKELTKLQIATNDMVTLWKYFLAKQESTLNKQ